MPSISFEFPTALESQNLLMAQIKIKFHDELAEIFDAIKIIRKDWSLHKSEFSTPISEPVIYFLRNKGYRVMQFQEKDEMLNQSYQRNATIEF